MRHQLKNVYFKISPGFLIVIAVLIYLDGPGIVLRAVWACVLHEMGHWLAITAFKGKICAITLTAVGAEMSLEYSRPLSYRKDIITAIAGPIVNLIIAGLALRCGWYLFAGFNLCFGLLNLLPVYALDGGRILCSMINMYDPGRAETVCRWVSVFLSGTLLGLGIAAWSRWGNLTILITAVWLVVNTMKS